MEHQTADEKESPGSATTTRPPLGVDITSSDRSMFDLPSAQGETESERLLVSLCKRSFLSLWSYPNTFTDEGVRESKASSGNEFADVLVVFGNDVIIISDKDIRFNDAIPIETAWPRWFKSAVTKSVRQLYGAMNWAKRFPERIYLDATCQRPLPTKLPEPGDARFHLVATTRGSVTACAQQHPGSFGSHMVNTGVVGDEHRHHAFTVGVVDPKKPFVHVFDELTLERVLKARDTAPDFIAYLKAREEFLTTPDLTVIAAGEEQLLAAYLSNMRDDDHWFLPPPGTTAAADALWFDESHWEHLLERPEYQAKKRADRISYTWDRLIDRFVTMGDPALFGEPLPNHDLERALRIIASTSRFERRFLSEAFFQMAGAASRTPGMRRFRLLTTPQKPDIAYVFLIDPLHAGEDYVSYRRRRSAALQTYLECAPLKMPAANTFVGMAFDHPVKDYDGGSEDLAIYRLADGGAPDLVELRRVADQLGILSEALPFQNAYTQDFPQVTRETGVKGSTPASKEKTANRAKRKKKKKKKKKKRIAEASKRGNR